MQGATATGQKGNDVRMSRHWMLGLVAGTVVLAACRDSAGPPADGLPALGRAPQQVRWADGPPALRAVGLTPTTLIAGDPMVEGLSFSATGLELDAYTVSFWAVAGQSRGIQINWLDTDTWQPYLIFDVPNDALKTLPDGRPIVVGDSVLITVTIDTLDMVAHFEPTGLAFRSSKPALLQLWYAGARGDLNGDSGADASDSAIELTALGLWYQETAADPWSRLDAAVQSVSDDWFRAALEHFSGYAIAW